MNQTMRLDLYFELIPIDPKSGLKNIPVGGGSKFYSDKKNFSQQVFEDNFLSADPRLAFINPSGKYSSEIGAEKFREYYDSKLDKEHCIILSFAYANSPSNYLDKDQPFEDGKGGYYIQISRNTWPLKPFIPNDPSSFPNRSVAPPKPLIIDDQIEFEVDRILDSCQHHKRTEYLILWKGYSLDQATWEPLAHLAYASKAIKTFLQGKHM